MEINYLTFFNSKEKQPFIRHPKPKTLVEKLQAATEKANEQNTQNTNKTKSRKREERE
jgi:hypothetical protein